MGPLLPGASETSEATQRVVDEEVKRIVETAHDGGHRRCCASIGQTSTRWSPPCSIARRSTRSTPTRPPACRATARARRAGRPDHQLTELERPATREARARGVPEADFGLVDQPTQVDLFAVAKRREVDQPAVDVAHDNVDGVELVQSARLSSTSAAGHLPARVRPPACGSSELIAVRARSPSSTSSPGAAHRVDPLGDPPRTAVACSSV